MFLVHVDDFDGASAYAPRLNIGSASIIALVKSKDVSRAILAEWHGYHGSEKVLFSLHHSMHYNVYLLVSKHYFVLLVLSDPHLVHEWLNILWIESAEELSCAQFLSDLVTEVDLERLVFDAVVCTI